MKRKILISALALIVSLPTTLPVLAGGYLTNTNQNAAFVRMLARGASIDIDGVYSNPAGLSFLPKDGFYLSFTIQSAYQNRNIEATSPLWTMDGNSTTQKFEGTASAPVVPSFHGVYKKGDWTLSLGFSFVGGGGKASFDEGLPMFNAMTIGMLTSMSSGSLTPSMYNITSAMDGRQYIYGLQLGVSYKIADWVSAFVGGRMNYFSGGYEGFLTATAKEPYASALGVSKLVHMALDCDQTGWGLTPIIGADFKFGKFNFGIKYEFITNLNIENKTKNIEMETELLVSDATSAATIEALKSQVFADYMDGVNTPSDIPAILSIAGQYSILPSLRLTLEYHFYDDKKAGMASVTLSDGTSVEKQKTLTRGTNEYLAGIEWDINDIITVSGGYQRTSYGLSDDFQTDTSFSCSSYSIGLGGRVNFNPKWSLDLGYFWTTYEDYTKESDNYYSTSMSGTNVYSRTNKVFAATVNYKF